MGLHRVKGRGWRYDFQYQGQRYTKGFYQTKQEARAAQEEKRKQVKAQTPTPTVTTFSTVANEYLDLCERKFHRKTYRYKRSVCRWFIQFAGDLPMEQITVRTVESYLTTRVPNSNYNTHLKILKSLFSWAWKRRLIDHNPCSFIDHLPTDKFQKRIYSQEDMVKIFFAAGDLRPFFLALFALAGRVGEVSRLRWEDVNFTKRQVTLWTSKGGKLRGQDKAINDELFETLKHLYTKKSGAYVFPNPKTGLPFVDRTKQIKRVCKAAGVPYLGWHAIRHHVASLLSDKFKVSLPTIQKMLGHANIMTTQHYVQSLSEGVREAAELLQSSTMESHNENEIIKKDGANQG